MIACSSPGKFGDTLYSVPSARYLASLYGPVDFYISGYYGAIQRLLNYQEDYINECVIADEYGYKVTSHGWGAQPWDMSKAMIKRPYEYIFQFGYRNFPDRPLPEFDLSENGILGINPSMLGCFKGPWLPKAEYEVCKEQPDKHILNEPYVIVAPRGDLTTDRVGRSMKDIFYDFAAKCPLRIVQIGARGEAWPWQDSLDITGLDWLETVSWLKEARGFYGIISAQGALAHGFDMPKVFPHNGGGWDMRHVVRTETSMYAVMPRAETVLEFMGLR